MGLTTDLQRTYNSKFAASKKNIGSFCLVRLDSLPLLYEGGTGLLERETCKTRAKPKRSISPSNRVASSDRMIMASSLFRV